MHNLNGTGMTAMFQWMMQLGFTIVTFWKLIGTSGSNTLILHNLPGRFSYSLGISSCRTYLPRTMLILTDYMWLDTCMHHTTCSLWCHFLWLRVYTSRKGRAGESGRVSTLAWDSMAASGLSCRKPLVGPGPFLSSFIRMGLENYLLTM